MTTFIPRMSSLRPLLMYYYIENLQLSSYLWFKLLSIECKTLDVQLA